MKLKKIKTENLIALLAIVFSFIGGPIFLNLISGSGELKLFSPTVYQLKEKNSLFSIVDLKMENIGDEPINLTRIVISVEKCFLFDPASEKLAMIPASAEYDINLSNVSSGENMQLDIFHQLTPSESDRIHIRLGGNRFLKMEDNSLEKGNSSYLSRIKLNFWEDDKFLASSEEIDVLVIVNDYDSKSTREVSFFDHNKVKIQNHPKLTKNVIKKIMNSKGMPPPNWINQ